MASKKGQCPVNFLWRGRGFGSLLMKLSLAFGFFGWLASLILELNHYQLFSRRQLFWWVIGSWCVGKLICYAQKLWCPEEDSNLHEENFTRT